MIGNDIVDLNLAKTESNWQRKGYLNKIMSEREQTLLKNAVNKELAVWNFWSRKEAVYKLLLQKGANPGYYPIKIECLDLNDELGLVHFENQLFYTKTETTLNYVYSEAVLNIKDFKYINGLKNDNLLLKINNIPFIKINDVLNNVSKTHHGNYERIVYLKKD